MWSSLMRSLDRYRLALLIRNSLSFQVILFLFYTQLYSVETTHPDNAGKTGESCGGLVGAFKRLEEEAVLLPGLTPDRARENREIKSAGRVIEITPANNEALKNLHQDQNNGTMIYIVIRLKTKEGIKEYAVIFPRVPNKDIDLEGNEDFFVSHRSLYNKFAEFVVRSGIGFERWEVIGAGEIIVEFHQIALINNKSGTFLPEQLDHSVDVLEIIGLRLVREKRRNLVPTVIRNYSFQKKRSHIEDIEKAKGEIIFFRNTKILLLSESIRFLDVLLSMYYPSPNPLESRANYMEVNKAIVKTTLPNIKGTDSFDFSIFLITYLGNMDSIYSVIFMMQCNLRINMADVLTTTRKIVKHDLETKLRTTWERASHITAFHLYIEQKNSLERVFGDSSELAVKIENYRRFRGVGE